MATGKPTRAAVKKALLERLKKMNACDAANKDLMEQYLDARDRLMHLEDAYIDRWNEYDEAETNKIATEIANMGKLMNAMGLNETPKAWAGRCLKIGFLSSWRCGTLFRRQIKASGSGAEAISQPPAPGNCTKRTTRQVGIL